MSWIKLDDKCPDHPKVGGLSDRGFRAWVTAMCYASAYLTDGVLPAVFLQRVAPKVRAELVGAGLWVVADGETIIHDYLEHQTGRAAVERERERSRERRAAGRPVEDRRTTAGRPEKDRDQNTEDRIQKQNRPAEGAGLSAAPPVVVPPSGPIRHPSPLAWDRQHGRHIVGFCSWVCLPQSVFDEFVNRVIGAGATEPEAVAQVRAWAGGVRDAWAGKIPGDNIFEFWRHEWAATHGSNRPAVVAAGQMSHGDAVRGALEAIHGR
jgi:hypothetical protein